jgi:hypothetical protein
MTGTKEIQYTQVCQEEHTTEEYHGRFVFATIFRRHGRKLFGAEFWGLALQLLTGQAAATTICQIS